MSSMVKRCLIVYIALIAPVTVRAWGATFTETRELDPIRCNYGSVARVIDHMNAFLAQVNSKPNHASAQIEASKASSEVSFTDRLEPSTAAEAVPIATSFTYTYSCYDCSAITRVSLEFTDYQRSTAIVGPSMEQVRALSALVSEQFRPLTHGFGGSGTRRMAGAILFVIGLVLSGLGVVMQTPVAPPSPKWLSTVFTVTGCSITISTWIVPGKEWFPGVIIYGQNPSFMTGYAPEITFWGAVISISISIFSVIWSVRATRREKDTLIPR